MTHGRTPAVRLVKWISALTLLALVAAACGSDAEGGAEGGGTEGGAAAEGAVEGTENIGVSAPDAEGVIRMVLAPDPVWDWLTDQGIRQEMEEAAQMQVLDSSTWDEFGVYAGGHADVVSAASYEVPDLEEATGIPTTVFGKYNEDKSMLAVRPGQGYQDLCDLEGQTIVSLSAVSSTIIWGAYAQEFCDLSLSSEGGDFDLVITDIQNLAPLVASGDAEACICMPDFAIPQLMNGEIEPLYDGRLASQIFADEFSDGHIGPMVNVFLGPTAWVERNQEEAAFLLSVWERGIQEWQENRDQIIEAYPQHFAVEGAEEVEYIQTFFDEQADWFVESVYLDEEWIEGENSVFELMRSSGFFPEDIENPEYMVIEPPQ